MNKNILTGLVVVLAGVIALISLWGGGNGPLGATINYTNSKNQAVLYNSYESLLQDITNVRSLVASVDNATTAALDFPALPTSTASGVATTTVVTGLSASLGDILLVAPATFTVSSTFSAIVTVASTTSATVQITALTAGGGLSAVDPASSVYNIIKLPFSTFVTPSALVTTTSTSN